MSIFVLWGFLIPNSSQMSLLRVVIITCILLILATVSYELWFHKDRLGRSYLEMHLGRNSAWQEHVLCFFLGTANIHRLIHDWYLGKRAAPWDNNFSWSEQEEFDSSN